MAIEKPTHTVVEAAKEWESISHMKAIIEDLTYELTCYISSENPTLMAKAVGRRDLAIEILQKMKAI